MEASGQSCTQVQVSTSNREKKACRQFLGPWEAFIPSVWRGKDQTADGAGDGEAGKVGAVGYAGVWRQNRGGKDKKVSRIGVREASKVTTSRHSGSWQTLLQNGRQSKIWNFKGTWGCQNHQKGRRQWGWLLRGGHGYWPLSSEWAQSPDS